MKFDYGVPFTPLLQLLSVLPPQSGSFLPPSYEQIMISPTSPMVPYYPKDFEVDANGKKNAWECIVRIPFIDQDILVDEVSRIDHINVLTETERLRNILGSDHRFIPPKKGTKPEKSGESGTGNANLGSGQGGRWGNALSEYTRKPPSGKYQRY